MKVKTLIAATVVGMCFGSCLMARASDPVVCSAVDARGDAATVTILEHNLSLQIVSATDGKTVALTASIKEDGLFGCRVFFDSKNRYAAIGVNPLGLKTGLLNIIVADLTVNKVIGDFKVQPSAQMGESLNLVGFLQDSSSLTVLGSGAPNHPTKSFSTTLFRVTGEQERPTETQILPANTLSVGNVSFVDAAHNRLWLRSSPQFCPLLSVPLIGNGSVGVAVDEASAKAACDAERAIGYPDENTLITAVTREPSDLVTHVDLRQRNVEQLALPAPGGHGSYTTVERGVLSPGGQFFAILRNLLSNTFSGDAYSRGTEIDIVRVSPLKFIGKIRLTSDTDPASISIDHRNGLVKVLYFEDGKWKSEHLKDAAIPD